jgi:hypothetical protein
MNRMMIGFILLLLAGLITPPAVQAFSRPDLGPAVSNASSVVQVAKKDNSCAGKFKRCVASCKRDAACISICEGDQTWCTIFGCGGSNKMC